MDLSDSQLESTKAITADKKIQIEIDAERAMYEERITKALQFQVNYRKQAASLAGQSYPIQTMFGGTDIGKRAGEINSQSGRLASVNESIRIIDSDRAQGRMKGESSMDFSLRQQKLALDKKELVLQKERILQEGKLLEMLATGFNKAVGKLSGDVASGAVGVLKGEKTEKEAMKEIAESFAETMITQLIQQFTANILAQLLSSFMLQGTVTGMNTSALIANTAALATNTASNIGNLMFRYGGMTVPGYRNGGIISAAEGTVANGPQAGYPAILHGKEAVVPLGEKNCWIS